MHTDKLFQFVFISGYGDIGRRVARRWKSRGIDTHALKRSALPPELRNNDTPAEVTIADLDDSATLPELKLSTALLYHFAPPSGDGEYDFRLQNLLNAINKKHLPQRVVLISTTAVYGDTHGQWIDESFTLNPSSLRGKRRLHTEKALQNWAQENAVDYVILRVPGIYGPGRLPLQRLEQGLPILREDLSPFTNRIHAEDLAMVCEIAAQRAPAGSIYNVTDGHPGTMSGYFKAIAKRFNLPDPPEVDWQQARKLMSVGMLSYLQESRRISNAKLLSELDITLQYPTLESGLVAMEEN